MTQDRQQQANKRLLFKLVLIVIGMFGFGFALVPIYDVICNITGINGKTGVLSTNKAASFEVDENRTITVELVANLNQNLNLEFRPKVFKMQVHPGKVYGTSFYAKNKSNKRMVGQAVPSVAPHEAAAHFSKTECFCFTNQTFEAGEGRDMPLRFVINPRLPEHVKTVSLSYTFFDVTQTAMK
ncbi:MAG: cytochrome c oxidase assembly protein [Gammaproteobacteria bacterium]|nr:cytochrome c oxidase assembly protein [Gammaproteobacteria bacterium]